ncbi:hypothetical protein FGRMN_3768 [Fusarium graminum]|nr:hypothetical protein FGRMN_3768 [Fusarium graminum]
MSDQATDPLAGIDSIDWSKLTHAYGPADDVPALLRQLQSTDPEVHLTAIDECWSTIYHQGTRYSSSARAVPFLYSLVKAQATKNRQNLLYMITALAIGDPDWAVPYGIDVGEWERKIAEAEDEHDRECMMHEFKAYEAVEQGLSFTMQWLKDESPAIRVTAAHALAFFPRQLNTSVPALLGLLDKETCKAVRGTAVLALAILFGHVKDGSEKNNILQQIQGCYTTCERENTGEDIYSWSCALALMILGRIQEGLVEKAEKVLTDEAYLSLLYASIDAEVWFPFGMLDLRELSQAVLAKTKDLSSTS